MTKLTQIEKDKFLDDHLHHRLTLLRTLRDRKMMGYNYQGQADIYCCVKDSNLIAVRLLLDFLGLKGKPDGNSYLLECNPRKPGPRFVDDIKIDDFGRPLVTPSDVPEISQKILGGVYIRADKELAHLTSTFNDEFNEEDALIEATKIVEELLRNYLYTHLGKQLPAMIR